MEGAPGMAVTSTPAVADSGCHPADPTLSSVSCLWAVPSTLVYTTVPMRLKAGGGRVDYMDPT